MGLPSTGSISMSQVNVELGRSSTNKISLGESAVRGLAGRSSGSVSMSHLRGKSAVNYVIRVGYHDYGQGVKSWGYYKTTNSTPSYGSVVSRGSELSRYEIAINYGVSKDANGNVQKNTRVFINRTDVGKSSHTVSYRVTGPNNVSLTFVNKVAWDDKIETWWATGDAPYVSGDIYSLSSKNGKNVEFRVEIL